jgi:hypothetical protein
MHYIDYVIENGEIWLQYAVQLNVKNESKESLKELRAQVVSDTKIEKYLNDITDFHSILVSNHKNPDLPIHKLIFLLDIGLDTDIPQIQLAIDEIMAHKDTNGVYQSLTNIPKHFGGSGEDMFSWCLCDAPLLLYALLKAGINYERYIKQGVDYLLNFYQTQGFSCTVSQELGKFRGPGRKDDCCPYATLIMLRLLSSISEYKDGEMLEELANVLLSLWENSSQRHPYMFYMGTDFRKLKAPSMWYDVVSVVDILSHVKSIRTDVRFIEMVELIRNKQDENGLFTPESIFQKYKGWDFGQKKKPSPYLTYHCHLILERADF